MNKKQDKIKPEEVQGTINLGTVKKINIGKDAVDNNESARPSEEFIESLEKGVKENVFPPSPSSANG